MDQATEFRLRTSSLRDFLDLTTEELNSFNSIAEMQGDTPFIRRTRIRVVFSCIEAHIFHLKSTAYAFSCVEPGNFSREEILKLQDLRSDKTQGYVRAKIPLKENVSFAFASFAKAFGRKYAINFSDSSGQRFLSAVAIRDRITHPKAPSDWRISDKENSLIEAAWKWFGEHLVAVSKVASGS